MKLAENMLKSLHEKLGFPIHQLVTTAYYRTENNCEWATTIAAVVFCKYE